MKYLTHILCFLVCITPCLADQVVHSKPSATSTIRDTIKNTNNIFVYEGLPHHLSESELLKTEKKRKDTTIIAGYPFYTPKIQAKGTAVTTLKEIISNSDNYIQFSGQKRCGGFHPDYAVEWTDGIKSYSILYCYGCNEVLIIDGKKTYLYDFKHTEELKNIFTAFQSKRP